MFLSVADSKQLKWVEFMDGCRGCLHSHPVHIHQPLCSIFLQQQGNRQSAPSQWSALMGWRGWTVGLRRLGNALEWEACLEFEQSEAFYGSNHPQQTHILKLLEVLEWKEMYYLNFWLFFKNQNCLLKKNKYPLKNLQTLPYLIRLTSQQLNLEYSRT